MVKAQFVVSGQAIEVAGDAQPDLIRVEVRIPAPDGVLETTVEFLGIDWPESQPEQYEPVQEPVMRLGNPTPVNKPLIVTDTPRPDTGRFRRIGPRIHGITPASPSVAEGGDWCIDEGTKA